MLKTITPLLFVVLWSTGFIGAKYGLPYAEPATLLGIRMLLNILVFAILIFLLSRKTLAIKQIGQALWVGFLIHGCYLGGVFYAIYLGLPAGLAALIVGLQPILTALMMAFFYGEKLKTRQWVGLFLGLTGVFLVLQGNIDFATTDNWGYPILCTLIALLGITFGTLYQKRHCGDHDLVTASCWQYFGALVIYIPLAFSLETRQVEWTLEFSLALAWLVLALSVAAVLLLLYLIRAGEASKVTSLFYMVPPVTALMGYVLFNEPFGVSAMLGFLCTAIGVYLVVTNKLKLPGFSRLSPSRN